jgi:hypothetical protein
VEKVVLGKEWGELVELERDNATEFILNLDIKI